MMLLLTLLAQTASGSGDTISAGAAGVIITAVIAFFLKGGWVQAAEKRGEEKARQQTSTVIENQPLLVKMAEEFVTRREFERLEGVLNVNVTDMKGLFQQTMQAIGTQNTTLTTKIERLAERLKTDLKESNTSHQAARGRIHNNVNRLAELLAALAAKVNLSDDIRALVDEIRREAKGKEGGE